MTLQKAPLHHRQQIERNRGNHSDAERSDRGEEERRETNRETEKEKEEEGGEEGEEREGERAESEGTCAGACDLTVEESLQALRDVAPRYTSLIESLFSFGLSSSRVNPLEEKYWSNPLEAPLPRAPSLKIYCFYGVSRETERGYVYRHVGRAERQEEKEREKAKGRSEDEDGDVPVPHWSLNNSHTNDHVAIRKGVKFNDGDGTVPLLSLGFMCSSGWKYFPRLNPSNSTVITREYIELNATMAILRAASSNEHVDLIGNSDLIADLIKVVSARKNHAVITGEEKRRIESETQGEKEKKKEEEKSVLTYPLVRDRIFSCIQEISAIAEQRVRARFDLNDPTA